MVHIEVKKRMAVGLKRVNRRPWRSVQKPTATMGRVALSPPADGPTASRQGVVGWQVAADAIL